MARRKRYGLFLFLAGATVLALSGAAVAQVRINEILANPGIDWNGDGSVDFKHDEWIEVANAGDAAVDLAGYWLRDGSGETPHIGLAGTLAPGAVRVVYGSDAVTWQQAHGAGSSGLSLNNAGDTVDLVILDPEDPQAYVTVDSYTYLPHEGDVDRASGRLADGCWALFDGLNPYCCETPPVSTGCMPSPGGPNACDPQTPADPATWGEIKALFD